MMSKHLKKGKQDTSGKVKSEQKKKKKAQREDRRNVDFFLFAGWKVDEFAPS